MARNRPIAQMCNSTAITLPRREARAYSDLCRDLRSADVTAFEQHTETLRRLLKLVESDLECTLSDFAANSEPSGVAAPTDLLTTAIKPVRPKRSTQKGNAQTKLIAALTKHHQYQDGSCLNTEPIGVNELAQQAGVSSSSAIGILQRPISRPR